MLINYRVINLYAIVCEFFNSKLSVTTSEKVKSGTTEIATEIATDIKLSFLLRIYDVNNVLFYKNE